MTALNLAKAPAAVPCFTSAEPSQLCSGVSAPCGDKEASQLRGLYRLPQHLLCEYWPDGLGAAGTRLLHGLLHLTCHIKESAKGAGVLLQSMKMPLTVLRDTIGPQRANDARAIHKGIAELRKTGFFDELEVQHRNGILRWRLSEPALGLLFDDDLYGLLDIRVVGRLKRPLPVWLYSLICMVQRMKWPRFTMLVKDLWNVAGRQGTPSWSELSRTFLRDLQLVAAESRGVFVLHLNWMGELAGIDEIALQLLHEQTQWSPKQLLGRKPSARQVVVVTAGEVRRYTLDAFTLSVAAELCRVQRPTR